MKITINGQDYTAALDAVRPLTIERKLNEPSICQLWLSLPANGSLAMPLRNQSLAVTGDDGTYYFTGYIAVTPLPEYAGLAIEGPRYRIAIQAVSDELLLDQMLMPPSAGVSDLTAGPGAGPAHRGIGLDWRCRPKGRPCRLRWATLLPIRARVGAKARGRPPAWRGPRIAR